MGNREVRTGAILILKALDFLSSKVKENMQKNTSKASAQALGPQIKQLKLRKDQTMLKEFL